jgi:NADPH:quinone reductase-like Zn-dependent oxidoreductase
MMNAVVLEEFGSAPALRSVERPSPGPGEVVVRVAASGVNPLDVKFTAGAAAHARVKPPMVLGIDLAGVVTELGPAARAVRLAFTRATGPARTAGSRGSASGR